MNIICITGATQSDLPLVANILNQAGMQAARPVTRGETIDMAYWHGQVVPAAVNGHDSPRPIASVGKLWEQLASDIFLTNIESTIWGWADVRSTWLLDYWLNFEPGLKFVLVCVSREQMLANAMTNGTDMASVDKMLLAWKAHHQELLRFNRANPKRSLLVDASHCAANPEALISLFSSRWAMPLTKTADIMPVRAAQDQLALYLAQQLCREHPQTAELQSELASAITRMGGGEVQTSEPTFLGKWGATLARLGKPKKALSLYAPQTEEILADFLMLRDKSIRLEQVSVAHGELETRNAQLAEGAVHLTQQNAETKSKLEEVVTEGKSLREQLTKESKLASELQAKIEQISNTQAENSEMLLLELHQAHLESEHYFQQHKEALARTSAAELRWQRMLHRDADCFDYEAIEILPATDSEDREITWRLTNFSMAGRDFPILEFKTPLERGTAGLAFTRLAEGVSPLTRWPAAVSERGELVLLPIGTKANIGERVERFLDLATRDWDLVKTLARLLVSAVQNPADLKFGANAQPEVLRTGLDKFSQIMQRFPTTFRFDRVSLKREQVNHDYEHLWLRFENAAFGAQRWPEFEFRLSCTNVGPKRFGTHPKLEFPEEFSKAPFDAWFVESYDDFGAKLEQRFAQPDSIDLAVWQRLSANDRTFVQALVKRLPAILGALEGAGVIIKRPWAEWTNMAGEMQGIMALSAASQPLPAPIEPAPPAGSASATEKPSQPPKAPPAKTGTRTPTKHAVKTVVTKPRVDPATKAVGTTHETKRIRKPVAIKPAQIGTVLRSK